MALMLSGVRPSMRLASVPTAMILRSLPSSRIATTDGSSRMIPWSLAYTSVLAVPKSMDKSRENNPRNALNMGAVWEPRLVGPLYHAARRDRRTTSARKREENRNAASVAASEVA